MAIKFGTDGWRAIIDQDFNDENVKLASQAIASYFKDSGKTSIVIGYDVRNKADYFARLTAQVMAENGIKVYLVQKFCPTPVTCFSVRDKKAGGGIMFTASHNPPEFLGLKYRTEEGASASSEDTNNITKNLEGLTVDQVKVKDYDEAIKDGSIEIFDPKPAYLEALGKIVDIEKIRKTPLKVLSNPMNGAGVEYLPQILSGGAIKLKVINGEPRADFGGKSPEPIVEKNVADAIDEMKKGGYDIGLSTDGDSDRIGIIDETGKMRTSLEANLLIVYYLLKIKNKRGPIVSTISDSVMVKHLTEKYGLAHYETKIGFKYVYEKMKETGAIWGGEESGGSAISEFIPDRDAQLMNLIILDLLVTVGKPLSEIMKMAQAEAGGAYEFRREDVHFDYKDYEQVKDVKGAELIANPPEEVSGRKVVKAGTEDGLKMYFEDGSWLLVRFSGTEPVLRVYAEAKSMAQVNELIGYAKKLFGVKEVLV